MNRYKRLLSDTVILGIGTVGSKLLVFLLMPFYTAWLSTSQFSTAELITGTANLLIPIACVGITNGIFRFAADKEADQKKVFSTSLALLGIGLGIFCLCSPLLGLITYFSGYTWLLISYVFLANVQGICSQYVRAIGRTKLFALQGILNTALTIGCNVLFLAVWKLGVTGYVLSVVIGNLLTTAFLVFSSRLWEVFRIRSIDRRLMRELMRFSVPLIPTTVCWLITNISDRYMVTYFCGADVNGIYSAAYKIPTILNLVAGIFQQAWQLSAVAESSDQKECSRFYSEVFRGFLSLIFIGSAGLILLSPFLTRLLLNKSFHGALEFMPTLLCAVTLESLVGFLASVYLVRKKSMHSFVTALIGTVGNVLLNLLLIPKMGALGAAIATLAAYALVLVVRLIDVPRMIPFRLCLPRLTVNLVLLVGSAALITFQPPHAIWFTLALTVVMILINAAALLRALHALVRKRSGSV